MKTEVKVRINVSLDRDDLKRMDEAGIKNRSDFIRNAVKKELDRFEEVQLQHFLRTREGLNVKIAEAQKRLSEQRFMRACEVVDRALDGLVHSREQFRPMYSTVEEMIDDLLGGTSLKDLTEDEKNRLRDYIRKGWSRLEEPEPCESEPRDEGD